jgi:hypothetical protein
MVSDVHLLNLLCTSAWHASHGFCQYNVSMKSMAAPSAEAVHCASINESNPSIRAFTICVLQGASRWLATRGSHPEVVRSLVEIAQVRGWSSITVKGTEEFWRSAWMEAAQAGLKVAGYQPTALHLAE